MRFWHPFAKDVLREIRSPGVPPSGWSPWRPFSGHVYGGEMQRLADEQAREGLPLLELSRPPTGAPSPS